MGNAAGVYHVGEGDASLELLNFFGEHFQGRVWNKDTFSYSKLLLDNMAIDHRGASAERQAEREQHVIMLQVKQKRPECVFLDERIFYRPCDVEKMADPSRVTVMPVTALHVQQNTSITPQIT